jgi:hypothetical protein
MNGCVRNRHAAKDAKKDTKEKQEMRFSSPLGTLGGLAVIRACAKRAT